MAEKNLLILKLPRTGSTYLAHILRQHPGLTVHQEYLNKHADRRKLLLSTPLGVRGVRDVVTSIICNRKWLDLGQLLTTSSSSHMIGATVNPLKEHMTEGDLHKVINNGTRVIVLTRKNLLKQHISQLNVKAEKEAGTERPYKSYRHDGTTTNRRFRISTEAITEIESLSEHRERLLQMVANLHVPKLFITYEEHINVSNKEPVLRAFADFLEIDYPDTWPTDEPQAENAPRYHKLVSDDLHDVIENYNDIATNPVMAQFL